MIILNRKNFITPRDPEKGFILVKKVLIWSVSKGEFLVNIRTMMPRIIGIIIRKAMVI